MIFPHVHLYDFYSVYFIRTFVSIMRAPIKGTNQHPSFMTLESKVRDNHHSDHRSFHNHLSQMFVIFFYAYKHPNHFLVSWERILKTDFLFRKWFKEDEFLA